MPIYAYKCSDCGHELDVIRKVSDPPLTECPNCGKATLVKQVTAAGFQLKGSGWYVTDFRDGGGKKKDAIKGDDKGKTDTGDAGTAAKVDGNSDSKTESKASDTAASNAQTAKADAKTDSKSESKSEATPKAAPPPPAPAGGAKSGGTG